MSKFAPPERMIGAPSVMVMLWAEMMLMIWPTTPSSKSVMAVVPPVLKRLLAEMEGVASSANVVTVDNLSLSLSVPVVAVSAPVETAPVVSNVLDPMSMLPKPEVMEPEFRALTVTNPVIVVTVFCVAVESVPASVVAVNVVIPPTVERHVAAPASVRIRLSASSALLRSDNDVAPGTI